MIVGTFDVDDFIHLLDGVEWRIQKNLDADGKVFRDYHVCEVDSGAVSAIVGELVHRAFLMRIPPGGHVHPHTDQAGRTWHYPLETNDECLFFDDGAPIKMEVGTIYEVNRAREHWSVNFGETNRTHLMVEF